MHLSEVTVVNGLDFPRPHFDEMKKQKESDRDNNRNEETTIVLFTSRSSSFMFCVLGLVFVSCHKWDYGQIKHRETDYEWS